MHCEYVRKMRMLTVFAMAVFFAPAYAEAQSSMALHQDSDGRYMLDASVNGVGVKTYYTEESWFASLSSTAYLFLYENGYIADADVRGMTTVVMPGGKSTKAGSLVIRSLKIGNVIVKGLPAFVIAKQKVPLVVGASAFDCFGEVTVEGDRLLVHDSGEAAAVPSPRVDTADSLRQSLREHLDAKRYAEACSCMEELRTIGPLSQYDSYQYVMLLNIHGRSEAVIEESQRWLAANEGRSATLDYWIYDALGDAYSMQKKTALAVGCYEKAVQTYYSIFSTSENEVRRSTAKDETLGQTLFGLGRQYAAAGNHKKAVNACSLAAKCGNAQAVDFCEKYKIKY